VDSLGRNKTRSLLAMLGIIIGVGSVITMLGLAEGTRREVEAQIRQRGTNTLTVRPREARQGGIGQGADSGQNLTEEDALAIPHACPAVLRISPRVGGSAQVKHGDKNTRTDVMGVTGEFFPIRNMQVARGRAFRAAEISGRARVCLLGPTVAELLFSFRDPLGKTVQVKGQPFQVIGVMVARGGSDADWDDRIWVPYTTTMRRLFGQKYVSRVEVQAADERSMDLAQEQIEALLRKRHGVRADQDDDFEIRNQADLLETAAETNGALTALLAGIAGISLLVGGIGIMNILLVSVAERTREIGIRRAVGALRRDILVQFLIEALVMCGAGALLGIGAGGLSCWLGATLASWPIEIRPTAVALSCGCAVAIGLVAGLYPAFRASGLSPLAALRHEH
jgi:putative ABC transport system permease protein